MAGDEEHHHEGSFGEGLASPAHHPERDPGHGDFAEGEELEEHDHEGTFAEGQERREHHPEDRDHGDFAVGQEDEEYVDDED